jgi:hypothetical protein
VVTCKVELVYTAKKSISLFLISCCLISSLTIYICVENLELELDPQRLEETNIRNFEFIVEDWIEQIAMSMLDAFFSKGAGGFKGAKW